MEKRTEQALDYLWEDSLLHMDMLESIRRGNADLIEATDRGVLLNDRPSGAYMMSAEDEEIAARMLAGLKHTDLFVAHQEFYVKAAQEKFTLMRKIPCHQAVYAGTAPIPIQSEGFSIRPLDESFLSFVWDNYSCADTNEKEYLVERLRSRAVYGAFVEGTPAGFVGMHAEGSIGMLEVLPPYRRRGIAAALESFQANRVLERAMVPFAQIICGNTASVGLHRKIGFSISQRPLFWLTKEQVKRTGVPGKVPAAGGFPVYIHPDHSEFPVQMGVFANSDG